MSEREEKPDESDASNGSGTETRPTPAKAPPKALPPWKVLLHNDEVNELDYVVETIVMITPLNKSSAVDRTLDAHHRGKTLLLTTHRERAELYVQPFGSRNLTVTIEQDEA